MATIRFLDRIKGEHEAYSYKKENVKNQNDRELVKVSPVFMNNSG
jgi:hypothetical protein